VKRSVGIAGSFGLIATTVGPLEHLRKRAAQILYALQGCQACVVHPFTLNEGVRSDTAPKAA
jgi:hypothetical protein